MNARQKAKKLKKELAELKADKTNGCKWLRVDETYYEPQEDFFYNNFYSDKPLISAHSVFNVRIGKTILKGVIAYDDEIVTIDSEKLDAVYNDLMKRRRES